MRILTAANGLVHHFTGRAYQANSAGIVDVPFPDAEGVSASGAGQALQALCTIGATADRPTVTGRPGSAANFPAMYGTTVGAMIFPVVSSGVVSWINVAGAAV
jgi:hypothetical protein